MPVRAINETGSALANELHGRGVDSIPEPGWTMAPGNSPRFRSLGANSLIVAILSPFLALSSSKVQRFLLAVVVLDIPIQLGRTFFLRAHEADLGAVKGLTISVTTMAVAGLYLSWFLRVLVGRIPRARGSLHGNWALLAYVAISAFSMLIAQDAALSSFEVFLLLEASLVYFYVANNVQTREEVTFVLRVLLGGCLLESLIMIVMQFTVTPATQWDYAIHLIAEPAGNSGLMRIGGTIGVPNVAGAYLSILLACAAAVLFTSLGRMYRWLAMGVLGFGSIALISTFSRGAWIALTIAVSAICFSVWLRRGLSLKGPIALLAVGALLYIPFHGLISERLFGDDKGSAEVRIPLMQLAYRMIADNPVLGVGANNFAVAMDRYLTPEFRHGWRFAVHNKYLLVLAETGIGGLLAYLAFLLGTLRTGWRCWKVQDSLLSPLALGFVAGIAGHMVHLTVDLFHVRPVQQLLWLVAGLLTAMYRISQPIPDSQTEIP
jgi:putative inorganic carbon (HCO3(-)) transporter